MTTTLALDVRLQPDDLARALRHDVIRGLSTRPRHLPPKWFYDERGSLLFDEITRLPEYYPTRREREILEREADEIARRSGAETLIELGSGTSDKTRRLLTALDNNGTLRRYVPLDVSAPPLQAASAAIAVDFPTVDIHPIVGDFDRHLDALPPGGRRLVAFLGGTIGNMGPAARIRFLGALRAVLAPGDCLLLGTDLVKDEDRLVRAYDDSAGVTAAFNLNVLQVLNRELDATFVPERFAHVAVWDARNEWIEMRLRSTVDQIVEIRALDMRLSFRADEDIRTEISAKFRRERVRRELEASGWLLDEWWTDRDGDYGVSLAVAR